MQLCSACSVQLWKLSRLQLQSSLVQLDGEETLQLEEPPSQLCSFSSEQL